MPAISPAPRAASLGKYLMKKTNRRRCRIRRSRKRSANNRHHAPEQAFAQAGAKSAVVSKMAGNAEFEVSSNPVGQGKVARSSRDLVRF